MYGLESSREGRRNDRELNLHAMVEYVGLHAAVSGQVFGDYKDSDIMLGW